jgi:hypothetical protein
LGVASVITPWVPKQPSYTTVGERRRSLIFIHTLGLSANAPDAPQPWAYCANSLTFLMLLCKEACGQHQISTTLLVEKGRENAPYSMTEKFTGFHHNPDMAGNRTATY